MKLYLDCIKEERILKVIQFIADEEVKRGRHPFDVYKNGNCGNHYKHLKSVFHCAQPIILFINTMTKEPITTFDEFEKTTSLNHSIWGHCLTKIGNIYCDTQGIIESNAIYPYKDVDKNEVDTVIKNFSDHYSCALYKREFKKFPNKTIEMELKNKEFKLMEQTTERVKEFVNSPEYQSSL